MRMTKGSRFMAGNPWVQAEVSNKDRLKSDQSKVEGKMTSEQSQTKFIMLSFYQKEKGKWRDLMDHIRNKTLPNQKVESDGGAISQSLKTTHPWKYIKSQELTGHTLRSLGSSPASTQMPSFIPFIAGSGCTHTLASFSLPE